MENENVNNSTNPEQIVFDDYMKFLDDLIQGELSGMVPDPKKYLIASVFSEQAEQAGSGQFAAFAKNCKDLESLPPDILISKYEYELKNNPYAKSLQLYDKVSSVTGLMKSLFSDVADIKEIMDSAKGLNRDSYEYRQKIAQIAPEIFNIASTIIGTGSGSICGIVSMELNIGSQLLTTGLKIVDQYVAQLKVYDDILDSVLSGEEINYSKAEVDALASSTVRSGQLEYQKALDAYNQFASDYAWLFNMEVGNTELAGEKAEYQGLLSQYNSSISEVQSLYHSINDTGIKLGMDGELGSNIAGGILNSGSEKAFNELLTEIRAIFYTAEVTKSPIVLDLDGDGVETTLLKDGIHFDQNDNGFSEKTSWVGKDDGLLVRDINGDSVIDGGKELFGDSTLLTNGTKAANGFDALAELDSNKDGVIDIKDAAFGELRIWKDSNGNGVTDKGELMTLSDAQISSISTKYATSTMVDAQGNEHRQISTYTKSDGTTAAIEDVWFKVDAMFTAARDKLEETTEIAKLPDLMGFGNAYSLHQAMLHDSSKHLQALVEQFIGETDPGKKKQLITNIIYAWTGVENIDPNSRATSQIYGNAIGDARKLEALEVLFGEKYLGVWCWNEKDPNPHGQAAPLLLEAFDKLSNFIYSQLLAQTEMKELFSKMTLVWDEKSNAVKLDLSNIASEILVQISYDEESGKKKLREVVNSLNQLKLIDIADYSTFYKTFETKGEDYLRILECAGKVEILGTGGNDTLIGTNQSEAIWGYEGNDSISSGGGDNRLYGGDGTDTLAGGEGDDYLEGGTGDDILYGENGYGKGNDVLDGGTGNDKLYGGSGNDTYRFGRGYGIDTIYDSDITNGNVDTLAFLDGVSP
ncbi:hypothetical protein SAMN02745217_04372, partial [Anaerocolumna xylanovorans DSM 12503]